MATKKKIKKSDTPKLSPIPTNKELISLTAPQQIPGSDGRFVSKEKRNTDLHVYDDYTEKNFNAYSNNRVLRRRIAREIIKCGKNPVHFLDAYGKIQHPQKGLIRFKLFDYQEDLIKTFKNKRKVIVLKSRQTGISTITAGFIAWFALFRKHKNVLIISKDQATAINLIRKVKTILNSLPKYLRIANITTDNKQSIELSNGSRVKAFPKTEDVARSEAASLVVVDEAAFIRGMDKIWLAMSPTISTGGNIILVSTPNGLGNIFHSLWVGAEEGNNDFVTKKIMWHQRPEFDKAWFENETKGKTSREINQELLCAFLGSGDSVLEEEDFKFIESCNKQPIYKEGPDRNIWIFEEPEPHHTYCVGCDVSRGDATDFTAGHVIDINTMRVVAEYKAKLPIEDFGEVFFPLGIKYNEAAMVIENTGLGIAACNKMIELGYPKIYFTQKKSMDTKAPTQDVAKKIIFKDGRSHVYSKHLVPGFTTSYKTRPVIISKMLEHIRLKAIELPSKRLYNEFLAFVWDNGKPQASPGHNDDLIIALAVGLWAVDIMKYSTSYDTAESMPIIRAVKKTTEVGIIPADQTNRVYDPIISQQAAKRHKEYAQRIYRVRVGNEIINWMDILSDKK